MGRIALSCLAALVLDAAGCCSSSTRACDPPGPALRVLVFGDFGDDTPQRAAVSAAMAAAHRRAPFDLVLAVGDNIYDCGPDLQLRGARDCAFERDGNTVSPSFRAPYDPRFELAHELALQPLSPAPIRLALGNHDVAAGGGCAIDGLPASSQARLKACLEVAHRSPQWAMPGRHYVVDPGPARFVVFDTNLLGGDYGGFTLDGEIRFIADAVLGCGGRPCFLVGHHPPATAGQHKVDLTAAYLDRVARVEAAAGPGVSAWLAGHDHDLQHLVAPAGYDVLVSGNTSRGRDERFEAAEPAGTEARFFSTTWGFLVVEVAADGWAARFEDDRGQPLHCCAARGGSCQPIACGG